MKKIADTLPQAGAKAVVKAMFSNPAFISALAAPFVGIGVSALADRAGQHNQSKQLAQSYRTMLDYHPVLKKRDPVMVQRVFNSLKNVNPQLARDPMVAGAWVHNVIETGSELGPGSESQSLLKAVESLAGIRGQLAAANKNESDKSRNYGALAQHAVSTIGQGLVVENKTFAEIEKLRQDVIKDVKKMDAQIEERTVKLKKLDEELERHVKGGPTKTSSLRGMLDALRV